MTLSWQVVLPLKKIKPENYCLIRLQLKTYSWTIFSPFHNIYPYSIYSYPQELGNKTCNIILSEYKAVFQVSAASRTIFCLKKKVSLIITTQAQTSTTRRKIQGKIRGAGQTRGLLYDQSNRIHIFTTTKEYFDIPGILRPHVISLDRNMAVRTHVFDKALSLSLRVYTLLKSTLSNPPQQSGLIAVIAAEFMKTSSFHINPKPQDMLFFNKQQL